jgi:hypothetical protein
MELNTGVKMGIRVTWDNAEKNVIRYDFDRNWNWNEFHVAAQQAFDMTRSVPHIVDTISNFPPGVNLPANALFQFRRIMRAAPPNRGMTVIVGVSLFIRNMVATFSKIAKPLADRLMVVSSLDEARAALAARRAKRQS